MRGSLLLAVVAGLALAAPAQNRNLATSTPASYARPQITQPLDESQQIILKGNTHPLATAQYDRGAAPANLPMDRMLLVLKRSTEQETALRQLLDAQQDKSSPNYHKWLTPDEFGKQFGVADSDLQVVIGWLQTHGFNVAGASHGRIVIEFSGTAAQVQETFGTAIHQYVVKGQSHWANASDPQIPAALTPVVAGVASLNSFTKHPLSHFIGSYSKVTHELSAAQPEFTFSGGCTQSGNCYAVGPYDFATIYNVLPLWNETPAVDGTGQTIAIVGRSNINMNDVTTFRSLFGLPANNPNIILNGPDPGIGFDEGEADIDVQWSGAVAKNATIDFVVSQSTETSDGVDLSSQYIVDNNLAPVMSESYGACELAFGTAGNQFFSQMWQQAAAQGITVLVASGDNGSAGCDFFQGTVPQPAQRGLAVSGIASTPYNIAVGGTEFNQFTNASNYWNPSNDANNASAKGYIPEIPWDDSCTNPAFALVTGGSTNAETNCNNSNFVNYVLTIAGSGGASNIYTKPGWQTASGTDNQRDLPDVSLFASNGFLGSFYVICQADATGGSCGLNNLAGYGGTSVAAPAFAGIMALVNQKTGSPQGQANYLLYKLASQQPTAFHDVSTGTIAMPCQAGTPNCTVAGAGHAYGVLSGFAAAAGYDKATGLGSVNAANLVNNWSSVVLKTSKTTLNSITTPITHGQSVTISATVAPASGSTPVPTGSLSLLNGTKNLGIAAFQLSNGTASGTTKDLPGGTYNLIAHYAGDGIYVGSDSNGVPVTVNPESSSSFVHMETFSPTTGQLVNSNATTAAYGSPYLLRVDVENSQGTVCAPMQATANSCPSGTVVLTDNSAPLDAGTYTLNNLGYLEDQTIQLPGGNHNVVASYAGDASYKNSTGSTNLMITPAATTMGPVTGTTQATVGVTASLLTTVNTLSSGVAPTGTVTFSSNSGALSGNVIYSPSNATSTAPASLGAQINTTFSAPGTYSVSARYAGDNNYSASSTTSGLSVKVMYPAPTVTESASSQSVQAGTSITLTALVDTTNNVTQPTGSVTFVDPAAGTLPGTVTVTPMKDAAGNWELQATMTYTPTANETIYALYAGDTNYPSNQSQYMSVSVAGNDFALYANPNSVTVTAGGSAITNVTILGQSSYAGTVTFSPSSCSGLPAKSSCAFSAASITGPGSTTLTITTTAPQFGMLHTQPGLWWTASGGVFAAVVLFGVPLRRRNRGKLLGWITLGLLVTGLGCGGGGGSGGGTMIPGTPTGTYTVKVSGTSGSLTHTSTITLTVH